MNDRRSGARLIRDVLIELKKALKRSPTPTEVVAAVHSRVRKILAAESVVGDFSPRERPGALAGAASTSEPVYYAKDFKDAREASAILGAGALQRSRSARIMTGLCRDYPDLFGADVRLVENRRWVAISDHARAFAAKTIPLINEITTSTGTRSLNGIANELTSRGVPSANGGASWNAKQVSRVLAALPLAA
jgi:hypothetical protein